MTLIGEPGQVDMKRQHLPFIYGSLVIHSKIIRTPCSRDELPIKVLEFVGAGPDDFSHLIGALLIWGQLSLLHRLGNGRLAKDKAAGQEGFPFDPSGVIAGHLLLVGCHPNPGLLPDFFHQVEVGTELLIVGLF